VRTIDVDAARAATPGAEHVVHLNNAGAALAPGVVLDAQVAHLRREATVGGYEAAAEAEAEGRLGRTYEAIAELIGCEASEVAVVDSATRAWDLAVYSLPLGPGDRVLTTRAEYGANAIALLHLAGRTGCRIDLVDDDEHGQVDLDALDRELARGRVAFVSLVHVPTQSGLVNPAAEVGRRCRDAGVPLVLDACQSAGQLPLDVDELGCDVLTATARKFLRGPRGTGFGYVRTSLLERLDPVTLDLRAATWVAPERYELAPGARRFETWERSVAGHIGLGVAVDHALGWGLDAIATRDAALADGLRRRLAAIEGVTVRDRGRQLCAIVTFTVEGHEAAQVAAALRAQGVNVNASAATSAQHDLPHRGLTSVVRASVHYYNTEAELDRCAELVAQVARSA
jgi:cysteine desulfurase / selenocysteine lyase